ncbi:MAG: hypothetical protein QN187_03610 [Armatimonadota bacterium]|nr:hypothetical protein [Armatimonadota bacterium]MDR7518975.1 hypothetical protein [Armatimonadota bacterium]MDR7548554.1 hypothetical protein [Armatimonadota bacterium]
MTRILAATLVLTFVLVLPASARGQTRPDHSLLAYQAPDQRFTLSVGAWFGRGKWRFVGPVDVKADNTLLMLDARLRLRDRWWLAFDYAGGAWRNITFNDAPAPASVSGNVTISSVDVRYRVGPGPLMVDLLAGWQYYRARTEDSALATSDEARAGGPRLGAEAHIPLRGPWSARLFLAHAFAMNVTENFVSGGTTTTTTYGGTLTDAQFAIRYERSARLAGEAGWRFQRIDFRRPTDVLEHTLDGPFLHLIWRQ